MARELGFEALASVNALREARKVKAAAEKAEKAAAQAVKDLMDGEREGTIAGVTVVEIKSVTKHDVDRALLRDNFPEIAEAVDKVIEYDKIVLA